MRFRIHSETDGEAESERALRRRQSFLPVHGEKTALRLISEYGSVENVYENIGQVKGKLKEKLENDIF